MRFSAPLGFRLALWLALTSVAGPFIAIAQSASADARAGYEAMKQKDYARALGAFQTALAARPDDGPALYNAACAAARLGQADLAFVYLERAFPAGEEWWLGDLSRVEKDADFDSLKSDARWAALISTLQQRHAAVQAGPYAAVKAELLALHEADQVLRKKIPEIEAKHGRESPEIQALWQQIDASDTANLAAVEAILARHGWLGPKQVGTKANSALFLVIQHADLAIQQKYLPLMREAVKAGKAAGSSLALLEDRIALREGRRQTYGSQIFTNPDGTNYVAPLDDPDHVDTRRAAVGLGPLADYVKRWNITWDPVAYKELLPTLKNPFVQP